MASRKRAARDTVQPQPEKAGHDAAMLFYLITGVVGAVFLAVLQLRDRGWLTFEPYEYYVLQVILLSAIGLLGAWGWILGVFLVIRYRYSWRIMLPAATLVALGLLNFMSALFVFFGIVSPTLSAINVIGIYLYHLAASLVGIEWIIHKARH